MRVKKIIGSVLALLFMAMAGVVVIGFVGGESNMEDYCVTVSPGAAIKDVELSAQQHGYRYHKGIEPKAGSGEYVSLVTSGATMGRFVCEIHHDGSSVARTRYIYND